MCSYKIGLFSLFFSTVFLTTSTFASPTYKFVLGGLANPAIASNEVSHIHFKAGNNDFGGLLVWNHTDVHNEQVQLSGRADVLHCSRQIKGLYYNSQRGERLWPLDEDTAKTLGFSTQNTFVLTGGLFTSCGSGSVGSGGALAGSMTGGLSDAYAVYGYLQHTYQNVKYSLVAGVQYEQNKIRTGSKLFPTLQRFDNKFPLGVLYDSNGGLGFVGCKVNDSANLEQLAKDLSDSDLSTLFTLNSSGYPEYSGSVSLLDCTNIGLTLDQLLLLKVQGLIGLSTDIGSDASALLGNEQNAKTQYFSSVNLNNSTLINYAKRRSAELCRSKWMKTLPTSLPDVICIDSPSTPLSVDTQKIANKTLIVKNGSVKLSGKMANNSDPFTLFIDGGKLLINQEAGDMLGFNDQAYPTTNAGEVVASGIFLKGNFIINGIVSLPQNEQAQKNRVFIHGKFTSLNTYAEPSASRLTQVKDILKSSSISTKEVDLTQVFSWRCNYGSGSDGTACPISEYQTAPLIIINQNYPSSLIE